MRLFSLMCFRSTSLVLSCNIPLDSKSRFLHKISATLLEMEGNKGGETRAVNSSISSKRDVEKMQAIVNAEPQEGWDKSWDQGLTPWDLGKPTPIVQHLLQTKSLPKGRVLVPGCGSGYDVTEIASPERYVVGLDLSAIAIKKAKDLSASLPNANYFEFVKEDFFNWNPTQLFDLIFDYTFFCAIEPCMRLSWGRRMDELLKPDGELVTLMFPISDHAGGPPYKVSVSDYEEVLHPMGFKAICIIDNHLAVGRRQTVEKLGRWKRFSQCSRI